MKSQVLHSVIYIFGEAAGREIRNWSLLRMTGLTYWLFWFRPQVQVQWKLTANIVDCQLYRRYNGHSEHSFLRKYTYTYPDLSFPLHSDNISRRCDENGHWEKMNTTLCHPLNEKEATEVGQRIDNTNSTPVSSVVQFLVNSECCELIQLPFSTAMCAWHQ